MSLSQTAEEQSFLFFTATVEDLELPARQDVTGLRGGGEEGEGVVRRGGGRGCGQAGRRGGGEGVARPLGGEEGEGVARPGR